MLETSRDREGRGQLPDVFIGLVSPLQAWPGPTPLTKSGRTFREDGAWATFLE